LLKLRCLGCQWILMFVRVKPDLIGGKMPLIKNH
jgi:hypothetical protein